MNTHTLEAQPLPDARAVALPFAEGAIAPDHQELIKQDLRQSIQETLQAARQLPPEQCLKEIRRRLLAIQYRCCTVGKTFIFVEEEITCEQHQLGGHRLDAATLFRGPNPDASVAICVTHKGSLLHRSGCPWRIYRNAGDVSA